MTGRKYPMSERVGIVPPRAPERLPSRSQERTTMSSTSAPNRRSFFGRGAAIAAVPRGRRPGRTGIGRHPARRRADTAVNAQGYFVGRVEKNLYWVTDSTYQAAFLTTRDGVVLFDAPPTIGHNLQRAIDEVASANDVSGQVTTSVPLVGDLVRRTGVNAIRF